jgi:hypothetical protein
VPQLTGATSHDLADRAYFANVLLVCAANKHGHDDTGTIGSAEDLVALQPAEWSFTRQSAARLGRAGASTHLTLQDRGMGLIG